jgi:hypothetical protein
MATTTRPRTPARPDPAAETRFSLPSDWRFKMGDIAQQLEFVGVVNSFRSFHIDCGKPAEKPVHNRSKRPPLAIFNKLHK